MSYFCGQECPAVFVDIVHLQEVDIWFTYTKCHDNIHNDTIPTFVDGYKRTNLSDAKRVANQAGGRTGKTHARAGSWGLVHLAIHQSALGLRHLIPELDHTRLDHLSVEIVPLAGALPHTGEHGEPSVPLSDVVDELHDEHGLADTGTTEKTNLATLLVGSQEIHDLV